MWSDPDVMRLMVADCMSRREPCDPPSGYDADMAYDEALAERIRELVAGQKGIKEQRMFGGLAFLLRGNMAVAASGEGGILVRVDPEASSKLVATTKARPMIMRGKTMDGLAPRRCSRRPREATARALDRARHRVRRKPARQGVGLPLHAVPATPSIRDTFRLTR